MTEPRTQGKHKIRENIDALAIAVLMAVLMKYFAIEAYQIPTSSMQPVMMGSDVVGVTDRILVDKSCYILPWNEPKRWDIAVFRYPIRRTQPYVKRIVGMPGDHLRIGGGNVYRVRDGGDPTNPADLEILRRPPAVLAAHWKQLYPARAELFGDMSLLGTMFLASGGEWSEQDGALVVEQRNVSARSTLTPTLSGGMANRIYDGYPTWVAKTMRDQGQIGGEEQVQDARIHVVVEPREAVAELIVALDVNYEDGGGYTFKLIATGGQGRIAVDRRNEEVATSDAFPLPLAAGSSTELRFTHVDDECIAEVDGDEVMRLDCTAFRTLRAIAPTGQGSRGTVVPSFRVQGGGRIEFSDIEIDRDLHYVPTSGRRENGLRIFEVPDGHYFMMGDNTLQSVDSRDWTAITLGMTEDGQLVDPSTHPEARRIRGNLRAGAFAIMPDADENPVIVKEEKKVVFTDENGEVWTLDGEVMIDPGQERDYNQFSQWFASPEGGWTPTPDHAPLDYEHFVPREHIIGRPLLTFWRSWPWRWFHVGFIR